MLHARWTITAAVDCRATQCTSTWSQKNTVATLLSLQICAIPFHRLCQSRHFCTLEERALAMKMCMFWFRISHRRVDAICIVHVHCSHFYVRMNIFRKSLNER